MSIEVVTITSEQLNQIIEKQESHFLDFKAIEVKPGKLCKFISGFANADGGELYIGIDEKTLDNKKTRDWRGFDDQESANGHLQIFEKLFPLGDGYSYTFFPKHCGVKVYRYKTKESEGTRETLDFSPITIEGCLYKQIQKTVTTTIEIIEEIPKIGNQGLEKIQYPEETIHEIVTNALLHRDYSIASDTHIRIFDNRIEIENPGKLPGHVTVKNILKEQYARNGAIVRIINKFPNPPNKDVGEGLNTAFQAMAKLRLQPPEIKETDNSVIVYIKHEPLASIEVQIMSYLENHKEITNKIARKETGIRSEGTIKQGFYRLRDSGLIEPVPKRAKSNAAWRKVGTIDEDSEKAILSYEMYPEYERLVMDYFEEHEEITNRIGRELVGIDSGAVMKNIFYRLRKKGLIEIVPGKSRISAAWRKVQSRPT